MDGPTLHSNYPSDPPPDDGSPTHHEESEKAKAMQVEADLFEFSGHNDNLKPRDNAGLAVIEQQQVIPTTGARRPTGKWEYISFCIFYFSNNGAPIGSDGASLRQALLNLQYPSGSLRWGGQTLTTNSYLLDTTGITFAAQLLIQLTLGFYADYGVWRPWIMIVFQFILYICQFSMIALKRPDQWQAGVALYILGQISANIVTGFYAATFPGLVRDLPKMIESENEVKAGLKTPAEHAKLDGYERSKLYNLVNITGSALVVIFYAIAVGISAAIGWQTTAQLIYSYRVLMGYFGAVTVICTVPFFLLQKHRPGQKLPAGTKWWFCGIQQVWSAVKSIRYLKHALLYLVAYFLINESWGTVGTVIGILQNEVVDYDPLLINALSLVADLGGGSGTVLMLVLQKKFRFSVKAGVFYGACMTIPPAIWGAIGYYTNAIGYHHVWEFWVISAWNFQTAAWGSYATTMISEVVPAPKAYMFFSLFTTISQTSNFVGPFISSAIITRANGNNNAAFWLLFGMGLLGVIVLYFVDPDQAKIDNAIYLEREAQELYSAEQREEQKEIVKITEKLDKDALGAIA